MKYLQALLVFSVLFCPPIFAADPTSPEIIVPIQGGILENASTIEWSANDTNVDEWWVYAGPSAGSKGYLDSGLVTGAQELVVDGLPTDGSVIHVRLWFRESGVAWNYTDTTFEAATSSASVQITSPVDADIFTGPVETFSWDANGVSVTQWWLYAGTTLGGSQLFDSGNLETTTSAEVSGLLTDGSPVYVRLWHRSNNANWRYIDATYTAATLGAPSVTVPTEGANISGNSATFSWDVNESVVDEWWFFLGSTAGGDEHFDSESLQAETSVDVGGLPQDGSTVHARLWYRSSGGAWSSVDSQYTSLAVVNEPDNFCESFVSNADSFVVPNMAKPNYLVPYNDPVFGGRVTRITDSEFGEVNKPVYSTMQAWNADESLLMVYRTGVDEDGGHKLLDGHSYEFVQNLDFRPADIEQVYWSRTDPDIFFYVSRRPADYGMFKRFSVSANEATEVADFTAYCDSGLPTAGDDVQMHALNDDLFGFSCRKDDGSSIMFSYKPSTDEVITAPMGTGTNWSVGNSPMPSASGTSFWHHGFVIGTDLASIDFELDLGKVAEHSSLGMTSDGQDAYYQVSFDPSPNGCDGDVNNGVGHLVEHNLETGGCRNIISQAQGYPYTTSSTHVSALAFLKPNRVAVSSIGRNSQTPLFTNGNSAPPLFSEIYVAQTDPDDTVVCRFAHHRSYGKSATTGGYPAYFGEPHATISPSGTRVIFGSDWYDSGSVDSFVLELPDYVKP